MVLTNPVGVFAQQDSNVQSGTGPTEIALVDNTGELIEQPVDSVAGYQISSYQVDQSNYEPKLGTYSFSVTWQGIPAATLLLSVDREGDFYRVVSNARTNGAVSLFYNLRWQLEGLISAVTFKPVKSYTTQRENSRVRNTLLTFKDNGVLDTVRVKGDKPAIHTSYQVQASTLDPISAAFIARGVAWELGKEVKFDTFNGSSRYLITLTAKDEGKLMINGQNRDVWIIEPKVENITSPSSNKKLKAAKIYLSKDRSREVLQIVSSVFVGSVKTKLESFAPASSKEHLTRMAALSLLPQLTLKN